MNKVCVVTGGAAGIGRCTVEMFAEAGYTVYFIDKTPEMVQVMEEKMSDSEFLGDTQNLIRPEREFNPQLGYDLVRSQLIDRLQK